MPLLLQPSDSKLHSSQRVFLLRRQFALLPQTALAEKKALLRFSLRTLGAGEFVLENRLRLEKSFEAPLELAKQLVLLKQQAFAVNWVRRGLCPTLEGLPSGNLFSEQNGAQSHAAGICRAVARRASGCASRLAVGLLLPFSFPNAFLLPLFFAVAMRVLATPKQQGAKLLCPEKRRLQAAQGFCGKLESALHFALLPLNVFRLRRQLNSSGFLLP